VHTLAAGLFGGRADVVIDAVLLSTLVLVPLIVFAWLHARGGRYLEHRNTMLVTTVLLFIAVTAVEMDLRAMGGLFVLTEGGRFSGTTFLKVSAYLHVAISTVTGVWWAGLIGVSLWKFPSPPEPGAFGRYHRFGGRAALVLMGLTGITGLELYFIAFVL